jgi:methylated-DNA-protein-cysteine methyltransferase-like protein
MRPTSKRSAPSRRRTAGPRAGAESGTFALILRVVARIPRGRVATYGQVARLAGMPGAARAVGWALAALPDERPRRGSDGRPVGRDIPWHRVINAQGGISPRGGGLDCGERQAGRLRREGVRPSKGGRYDLVRYGWDGARAESATRSTSASRLSRRSN